MHPMKLHIRTVQTELVKKDEIKEVFGNEPTDYSMKINMFGRILPETKLSNGTSYENYGCGSCGK
jgi:hypothetical protein